MQNEVQPLFRSQLLIFADSPQARTYVEIRLIRVLGLTDVWNEWWPSSSGKERRRDGMSQSESELSI